MILSNSSEPEDAPAAFGAGAPIRDKAAMFTRTTITIDTVRRMARVARVRDARATGGLIRVALRSGWSFPAPADPRVAYVATPKDAVRIVCDATPVEAADDIAA